MPECKKWKKYVVVLFEGLLDLINYLTKVGTKLRNVSYLNVSRYAIKMYVFILKKKVKEEQSVFRLTWLLGIVCLK